MTSESATLQDSTHHSISIETPIPTEATIEYLGPAFLKINGKLPVVCSKKNLYEFLGKPDSMVTPDLEKICVSYFDKEFKYAYFGKSYFEICGDSAAACVIYFEEIELIYDKKIFLNKSTTITSLESIISYRDKQELDMAEPGKTTVLRIPISKENSDCWLLFFVNSKLKKLDYWMPC